jgi:outer membrane protein assembly factor BamD
VIKPIVPVNNVLPAIEKPADAPDQVNEIKSGSTPAQSATDAKKKKPKADLSDESSSKKKKKKGLSKLNPF